MAEPVSACPEGGQVWQRTADVVVAGTEDLNRSTESRRIWRLTSTGSGLQRIHESYGIGGCWRIVRKGEPVIPTLEEGPALSIPVATAVGRLQRHG
jgi:hypothetical protein